MLHRFDNGICMTCEARGRRGFDPEEPRDPHSGKWMHGTGAVEHLAKGAEKSAHQKPSPPTGADPLRLASRITLGDNERLAKSGLVRDTNGDASAVTALIDGPGGPKLRLGVVLPEDSRKWSAANKGATAEFDAAGINALHSELTRLKRQAPDMLKKYRADPLSRQSPEDVPPITGTIRGSRWGDVSYQLSLDRAEDYKRMDGQEYDVGRFTIALNVVPPGSGDSPYFTTGSRDPFYLDTTAQIQKLIDAVTPSGT